MISRSLLLDFANSRQIGPRCTFTRASAAWRTNSFGVLEAVPSGAPVFDYDPATLQCMGLRIWEARTNLLLNSAALATQNVTVTAVPHTLSFYGTGTVVLSGVAAATVVGAGAYPTRTTMTFTPTAGTLTLTVTGSVTFANLEIGATASPYIDTAGAQATRAADSCLITTLSPWFNAAEGTIVCEFTQNPTWVATPVVWAIGDSATFNETMYGSITSATQASNSVIDGGVSQIASSSFTGSLLATNKIAASYQADNFNFCLNGGGVKTDTAGAIPTVNTLAIGGASWSSSNKLNGHVRRLIYFPKQLSANLQELSR